MTVFRFVLFYLLIGFVIAYISMKKMKKSLNNFGFCIFLICSCFWPVNIACAIYNEHFASSDHKRRVDEAYDWIESKIFKEDP